MLMSFVVYVFITARLHQHASYFRALICPLSSVHRTCLSLRRSPLLSFLLLPRLSCQLLPHLPNYRLWMCSSDQRITTPPSLCGRPPCLQYHRTVGAAGCAGIERLIRSCSDSEVACRREHIGVSVPLRDFRRVHLLLVACMYPWNACALGIAAAAAGCSPGSRS